MEAEFWKRQALADLIPYWDKHARDSEFGAFHMNLSRDWKPRPPWEKLPPLVSRHVFGFSAAFLLSGNDRYLEVARRTAEYLLAHAWDSQHGGWFDRLARDGNVSVETKSVANQLYTNVGLTALYMVTGDKQVLSRVQKSVSIQRKRAHDDQFGGYAQALSRDLSVLDDGKNKHAHFSYVGSLLLNLYVHRKPAVLHFKLDGPGKHFVSLVDDPAVGVASVKMDGKPWTDFDATDRSVSVPSGKGHSVEVTLVPGPR
jgi:mannose/cellobiose epimerase-like protein (N-acyl-D-glucosamine 2-epimerase family)